MCTQKKRLSSRPTMERERQCSTQREDEEEEEEEEEEEQRVAKSFFVSRTPSPTNAHNTCACVCVCVCVYRRGERERDTYTSKSRRHLRYTRETKKGGDAPKDILIITRLRRRAVGIPIECTNVETRLWCATYRLSPQNTYLTRRRKYFHKRDQPLLKP